jgi:pimeloyl-ACP methyl ester carboxylesterase
LNSAEKISAIVNPGNSDISKSDGKYFDVVSFDPHGVNNTTPVMKCFPDSSSYDIWKYQQESDGIGSSTAISKMWARSKAVTSECSQSGGIAHHMNTPVVVADMVEIIEKHAEWRSKEAESWLASTEGQSVAVGLGKDHPYSKETILERTRWRKGEEKIQYWGFSYGTVLGATFAALQPHRVERVILDGVEDSTDYYSTAWALNLKDTDKIIDKFYDYCSAAGPKKCAFNFETSDPVDIKASFESLISDIKEDPIAVPATSTRGPDIITYSDVMLLIRYTVYKPLALFPQLADLLADLKGNGSAFADFKADHDKPSCPLQKCTEKAIKEPCYPDDGGEASAAIMCTDGADISEPTKEHFKEYAAALYNDSRWLGEYWSTIAIKCYHWKAKAAWRVKDGKYFDCGIYIEAYNWQRISGETLHILFFGLEILSIQ